MFGGLPSGSSVNGRGNLQLMSSNQGITSGSLNGLGTHIMGPSPGLSGSPTVQCSLSVGAKSLVFTGADSMGLPVSPRSFSSSNLSLSGTPDFVADPLIQQGSATRLDHQEFQQLQQQQQLLHGHELATSPQLQGQQMGLPQMQAQQVAALGTHQQLQSIQGFTSVKSEQQQMSPQVQILEGLAPVKVEQQIKLPLRQQLQPLQGLTSVKLEQVDSVLRQQLLQQHVQALQSIGPLKLDSRLHEQPFHQQISIPKIELKSEADLPHQVVQQSLLTSHLQRQEALQLHRQQSQQFQAQMNVLQQQRLLHQHRTQLQQQQQQQQQIAGPSKQLIFEPGICARRLTQYMSNQRQRPQDNNILFWRKFVGDFFAPQAKKRWCVSQYEISGRQPTGVFPQDVWHCKICGSSPGRGFETTIEVLPRLCKIKYDSGILDELLYVDISNEYRLSSGLMVLEYGKAIQESIFDQLRVVRDGQLRVIFSSDLKILSWEFCARGHEELLPRRLLVPQVTQLAAIAQKYQNAANQNQNAAPSLSLQELQSNCQLFVGAATQLTRTLEAPTVNDLGYTKRYVRCLQISQVVNSMKDFIDFSGKNGTGPIASLMNFPSGIASSGGFPGYQTMQQQEQLELHLFPSEQNAPQAPTNINISSSLNGSSNNALNTNTHSIGSFPTLLHQNPLTSLQNTLHANGSSSAATVVNTSSCGTVLNSLAASQRTSISCLHNCNPPPTTGQPSPANTISHSAQQNSLSSVVNLLQQSYCQVSEVNQNQNSNAVHHLLQEMLMPSQLKSGASFQQALEGGGNVGGSVSLNGRLVSGTGNLLNTANGLRICSNETEGLGGNSALTGSNIVNGGSGGNK